jgi:hypothetical protein
MEFAMTRQLNKIVAPPCRSEQHGLLDHSGWDAVSGEVALFWRV